MTGLKTLGFPRGSAIDGRTGRERRIPPKIKRAVRALLTGDERTIKGAAERVKISAEHLSRMLRAPHVQTFIDTEARAALGTGKLAATSRLLELIRADSEHVSFDATRHLLGINGISPADTSQVSVNVNVTPGYCIDIQTDPREDLAANRPSADLRTIEGKGISMAPSSPLPQRAIPPFPDLVQTGVGRDGGPIFSYRSPDDREEET